MTAAAPSPSASLSDHIQGSVVALGCGKMGGAIAQGWLAQGLRPDQLTVIEPHPAPWLTDLTAQGLRLNPADPAGLADLGNLGPVDAVMLAVKPQMMAEALSQVMNINARVWISIAAGTPLSFFEARLPAGAAVVRAMPNTPAAVGRGVTALIGGAAANTEANTEARALADSLLAAVGTTVWLEHEAQMDAVTAISGSGPAYVFHMIEALAAAGVAQGLPAALAATLARQTVIGAGALAAESPESAATLRENVTSPGGTTAAALARLARPEDGLTALMTETAAAAAARSRELGG